MAFTFPGDRSFLRRHLRLVLILLLALAVASVMGKRSVIRLYQMHQEQVVLEREIAQLATANAALAGEVRQLRTDPTKVESIAREELGLVKPGEIVYEFEAPLRSPSAGSGR
jgi:cell division protein FtsB